MNRASASLCGRQRRPLHHALGQSAVEFALILPVLALLLVVIADFGRVFFVSVAVNNAARAGAQYGSQSNTTAADSTSIEQAACNDYGISALATCLTVLNPTATQCTCGNPSNSDPACSRISSTYCKDASTQANYVLVNTSATFNTILTYPGVPSSVTLSGQAIMQVEEQ